MGQLPFGPRERSTSSRRRSPGGDSGRSTLGELRCCRRVGGVVRAPLRLRRADVGLYLPAGNRWSIENPSGGAASLVLTSAVGVHHLPPRRLASSPVISLPHEQRAGWTVVQVTCHRQVPFRIRRADYVHSVAAGAERGGHAHRKLEELLVAVTGSFDLVLHDGRRRTTIHLDRPAVGVYIPKYSWRELKNFSPGAVCLVLASLPYEESDYIRDFEEFVRGNGQLPTVGINRIRCLRRPALMWDDNPPVVGDRLDCDAECDLSNRPSGRSSTSCAPRG